MIVLNVLLKSIVQFAVQFELRQFLRVTFTPHVVFKQSIDWLDISFQFRTLKPKFIDLKLK